MKIKSVTISPLGTDIISRIDALAKREMRTRSNMIAWLLVQALNQLEGVDHGAQRQSNAGQPKDFPVGE